MITTIEPKVNPAGRYNLTQTAKLLGVCVNSINNYEKRGTLIPQYRKGTGKRFWKGTDIMKFWHAHY